jgi:16S rRNA processing protein RimM
MSRGEELVLLGKVVATHGIRGQLRVVSYSGESETISALRSVMLREPDGGVETFGIANVAAHGKKIIIALDGYDSINQVLQLVGREVFTTRAQMPDLPEGEYYWCDLLGLKVVTEQGESLGVVTDIIATGSNDVYVAKKGKREYLIPALEGVVVKISPDEGIMTVSPPDGLLDL